MNEKRKDDALVSLCEAVSEFGVLHLADLDDEIMQSVEQAICDREGELITQIQSNPQSTIRVTILLSQKIDGEIKLTQLLLVETSPETIN